MGTSTERYHRKKEIEKATGGTTGRHQKEVRRVDGKE